MTQLGPSKWRNESPAQKAFYRGVGDAIRIHRRQMIDGSGHVMTQDELASAIGIAACNVTNFENGRQRPYAHVLAKLAAVLGVEVSALCPAYPVEEHTPV